MFVGYICVPSSPGALNTLSKTIDSPISSFVMLLSDVVPDAV